MVFIFDLGTTGDGSTDYYFDEITQPGEYTTSGYYRSNSFL
jgi:hypothetical protein